MTGYNFHLDRKATDDLGRPIVSAVDVGTALGYSDPSKSIQLLVKRHADVFTDELTRVHRWKSKDGPAQQRRFTLEGAYLVALYARTKRASPFRRWLRRFWGVDHDHVINRYHLRHKRS